MWRESSATNFSSATLPPASKTSLLYAAEVGPVSISRTAQKMVVVAALLLTITAAAVCQDEAALAKRTAAGITGAEFRMGNAYSSGTGVPQDYGKAVVWWRKAADRGSADAQFNLAGAYHNGQGVPQDYVKSASWLRKAADQGDAEAEFMLSLCYYTGEGVPKFVEGALFWVDAALDSGRLAGADKANAVQYRDADAALVAPNVVSDLQQRAQKWTASHPGTPSK